MVTDTVEYADDVTSETDGYLRAVEACLDSLPAALEAYGDTNFEEAAATLSAHESAADEQLRDLRGLLGRLAPPNYTEVYLRTGEVMRLYALVDDVPDGAERFVRDLETVEPVFSAPVREEFAAMASLSVEITGLLTDVTAQFVHDLLTSGETTPLTDDVERIAALESECDAHRRAAVEHAFAQRATTEAMLVRDMAASLDAVADVAEDAADHLLFMQGASVQ